MNVQNEVADPPVALVDAVPGGRPAHWQTMSGGRSNPIWHVVPKQGSSFVCKLYESNRGNALFPNDPAAEAVALRALSGTGLAPDLLGTCLAGGRVAVMYTYLVGTVGPQDTADAACVLARLHSQPAPTELRLLPGGAQSILSQTGAMTRDLPVHLCDRLNASRPKTEVPPSDRCAFLHGDPVPANMIRTARGLTLIDWQCPAAGDPCEDAAVFLSPAMQALYGGTPLTPPQKRDFWTAYGDPEIATRYASLEPFFHWRMAAYCLWMSARGHADYGDASELEFAALEQTQGRQKT